MFHLMINNGYLRGCADSDIVVFVVLANTLTLPGVVQALGNALA